jgi:hypothetical protein
MFDGWYMDGGPSLSRNVAVACGVWRKLIRVAEKEAYVVEKIESRARSYTLERTAPAEDRKRPGGLAFLGAQAGLV